MPRSPLDWWIRAYLVAGLQAMSTVQSAPIISTVESSDSTGWYNALQVNASDRPAIAYYKNSAFALQYAICTANCKAQNPTWVVSVVDSSANVGPEYSSLQFNGDNPVISYHDATNRDLKLASCIADCETVTPQWIIVRVDTGGSVGSFSSLQLSEGRPIISYYDITNTALKLATCTAGCATAAPTWVVTAVDDAGDVGQYSSLRLFNGRPIIGYYDATNRNPKLATCTASCDTVTPTWVRAGVDNVLDAGEYTSLALTSAGMPVLAYYEATTGAAIVSTCVAQCASATPTWERVIADSAGNVGAHASLQLDNDRWMLSYYDGAPAQALKFTYCLLGCLSAQPTVYATTIDSSGRSGLFSSLQLSGGYAMIAYQDNLAFDLKFAVIDIVPPTVSAIVRIGPSPTNATIVSFLVTFSEDVVGVDAGDFILVQSGNLTGSVVSTVTGTGATRLVTVNVGDGSGQLRLDLIDDDTINDGTNPLGALLPGNGNFGAGESYVIDKAPPVLTSLIMPSPGNYVTGRSLDVSVNFGESVVIGTGGVAPSIALTIGAAVRNATYFSGSGGSTLSFRYVVAANDLDTDGIAIGATLSLNGSTLRDVAGNDVAALGLPGTALTNLVLVNASILNIDDSDVSTQYEAATDGVLLLRYLLGYRGGALTAGALGSNARRNAAQIDAYIASRLVLFDVDGDGEVRAPSDGLMIVRRLLGMTDAAAITADAKNSSRADADVVERIDSLRP